MENLYIKLSSGPYTLESSFTTAWIKLLKDKGYYVDKISDASIGVKKVDTYIRDNTTTYCCEIKLINKDIFQLDRIRSNQWSALRLWDSLGGEAIVVVYSKAFNDYKIIPFKLIKDLDKGDNVKLLFN